MKILVTKNIFIWSVLVSLFWHILLASLVSVAVMPTRLGLAKFSQVSFLGPILEETAFEKEQPERPTYGPAPYKGLLAGDNAGELLSDYIKKRPDTVGTARTLIDQMAVKDILWTKDKNELPGSTHPWEFTVYSTPQVEIEGSLSGRRLLYRPTIPPRPEWLDVGERGFSTRLKIGVSVEGVVETATVLTSSGWPALDILVLSHVRTWRFVPVPERFPDYGKSQIQVTGTSTAFGGIAEGNFLATSSNGKSAQELDRGIVSVRFDW